jgi:succinate dehydrogenase flavin-adding protein (antitoxin of CptAB toxin-antitoxin module)
MRELDFLLARYLDSDYSRAPAVEQAAFARLLELQDPVLWGLLLGREQAQDPELAHVVERIAHHRVG